MAAIKNSTNNKCWRRCGEKGTSVLCWYGCNLVQWLWKTVLRLLKKLKLSFCVCVLVTQSFLIICDFMDCSLPGSSVHGILQARILVWVAIPFSRGYSWPRDQIQVSCTAGRFFTVWATREVHMIQQSQCWAYTLRKPELRDTCTPVFITALFIVARTWKQPRCPSTDE